MPLLWNYDGGGQANCHILFVFLSLFRPLLWLLRASSHGSFLVSSFCRTSPTSQSLVRLDIQRVFMLSGEQTQDQYARECSNKQRETRPCFHKKHRLDAIFIKKNVLSFQVLTLGALGNAKQAITSCFFPFFA